MALFRYRFRTGSQPLTVEDYRALAERRIPRMAWAYLDGGAENQTTRDANRDAFRRWALRQRVLTGNDSPRLSVEIPGAELSMPVLLAPTGLSGLSHASGEPAAARAAEARGTRAVISTAASYSVEEVAEAARERHIFQLYPGAAGSGVTQALVDRARHAGYGALMMTVDGATIGNRTAERREGMGIPPELTPARVLNGLLHPRWCYGLVTRRRISARNLVDTGGARAGVESVRKHGRLVRPDLVWEDVKRVRDDWSGPFYIKGILDPDDAERAVAIGADGIVVSNHGGRQLDGAVASLDVLPMIADQVGDRVVVLMDGGVLHGSDIAKALCLGASAVLLGRAYLYGLGVGGQAGVERVLEILRDELTTVMLLMGVGDVRDFDRSCLLPAGASLDGRRAVAS